MCRRVTCSSCGKPTFAGCGMHIEQVLGDVPRADRCRCNEVKHEPKEKGPKTEPKEKGPKTSKAERAQAQAEAAKGSAAASAPGEAAPGANASAAPKSWWQSLFSK